MQQSSNNRRQGTNRKKQAVGKTANIVAANNRPRVFGDYCFDYLKICKHNIGTVSTNGNGSDIQSQSSVTVPATRGNNKGSVAQSVTQQSQSATSATVAPCPLCTLTNQMTKVFFLKEEDQREKSRLQSVRNRSILRTGLLHQWACNQSSLYYHITNAINLSVDQYNVNDFTFDIFLSTSLMSCFLDYHLDKEIDFDDLIKVLQRRNRIFEVGYFAVLMIQRQVRRYLTLQRVRTYLLTRFEYIPPTKTKRATYYDRERLRRCDRYPRLLLSMPHYHSALKLQKGFAISAIVEGRSLAGTVTYGENPGTPRTIKRRLDYEKKLSQERLENFKKSLEGLRESGINVGRVKMVGPHSDIDDMSVLTLNSKKEASLNNFEDISFAMIKLEQQSIRHLKQFVILHDLVYVTMYRITLTMQYQQQVTAMIKKRMDSLGGGNNVVGKEKTKGEAEKNSSMEKLVTSSPDQLVSVWLSPCAPCMSSRPFGLSIALLSVPSPSTLSDSSAARTATNLNRSSSSGTTPAASGKRITDPNSSVQFYRALQLLEQHAFDALKCSSAEEVLKKLFLKDLIPVYESIVNITQDECGIWNATYSNSSHPLLDGPGTSTRSKAQSGSGSGSASVTSFATADYNANKNRNNSYDEVDDVSVNSTVSQDTLMADQLLEAQEKQQHYEVLPFGIQLRPSYSDRSPSGLFRLFYFQEEVVAISSYSPWICYAEVMKNRDVILGNIRKFVNSNNMRTFVQTYYRNVNQRNGNDVPPPTASSSRKMSVSTGSSKLSTGKSSKSSNSQVVQNSLPPPSTFFTPAETMIFPEDDEAALSKPQDLNALNDQKVVALGDKYKFLKTLSMFQERHKKAQANISRRKPKKENVLGTRPISTTIGQPSDYEKQRLLFEQASPYFKGKQVLELIQQTRPPPTSSTKAPPKEKFVENMDDYTLALWKFGTGVDLDIESRIIRPPDIAETHPPAPGQLFVVDLHVSLPKPKQPAMGRKMSTVGGSSEENNSANSVVVDLHQVIGLFPCNQDKCPANLDCGLFEFDHFYQLNKPDKPKLAQSNNGSSGINSSAGDTSKSNETSSKANNAANSSNQLGNVVTWVNPDPITGVCLGRSLLPSGKEFQVRIIGSNPSREYLEDSLPKKVKIWLGIPMTSS